VRHAECLLCWKTTPWRLWLRRIEKSAAVQEKKTKPPVTSDDRDLETGKSRIFKCRYCILESVNSR